MQRQQITTFFHSGLLQRAEARRSELHDGYIVVFIPSTTAPSNIIYTYETVRGQVRIFKSLDNLRTELISIGFQDFSVRE